MHVSTRIAWVAFCAISLSSHPGGAQAMASRVGSITARQLLQTLRNSSNPDPAAAEAACCAILQGIGFTPTPGIPVFIVDTNGQAVAGGGVGQDGQAITGGNNGQAAKLVDMQMCTCSAGVANATYSGAGRIRLRGGNNSALRDTIRQYYIKLEDNQPIAGLATAKNWVLRGPQNDTLGLHEFLAMNLSAATGLWTPHTRYTELYLIEDGAPIKSQDYRGIIVLEEHIDQGKNRVDIAKNSKMDTDLTGGYILEYKHGDNPKNDPTINNTISGMQWIVKYPGNFNSSKLSYIQGYMNSFEAALFGPAFLDPVNGWRKYASPVTFTDWFLTHEIIKNAKHTYHGTSFTNKYEEVFATWSEEVHAVQDKAGLLNMGPTWSPKNGFGTCCGFPVDGFENNGISNGSSGGSAISPEGWLFNICNETSRCSHQPNFPLATWFIRLWEDPSFVRGCADRWSQLRRSDWSDASVTGALMSQQSLLQPAALRGFARWNDVLLAPYGATNPVAFYNQAFTTLQSWVLPRLAWLDGAFQAVTAAGYTMPSTTSAVTATAG